MASRKQPDAQSSAGAAEPKKPRGRPFQKGQSGNPGGRKPIPAEVKEAARALTPKCLAVLEEVMCNTEEKGSARVSAAQALLDRGWGKAPVTLDDEAGKAQGRLVIVGLVDA